MANGRWRGTTLTFCFAMAGIASVLYSHAIEGFFGPDDTMMPARGGNPDLTDEEVKLAVDYMLALATYYLEQTGDSK